MWKGEIVSFLAYGMEDRQRCKAIWQFQGFQAGSAPTWLTNSIQLEKKEKKHERANMHLKKKKSQVHF